MSRSFSAWACLVGFAFMVCISFSDIPPSWYKKLDSWVASKSSTSNNLFFLNKSLCFLSIFLQLFSFFPDYLETCPNVRRCVFLRGFPLVNLRIELTSQSENMSNRCQREAQVCFLRSVVNTIRGLILSVKPQFCLVAARVGSSLVSTWFAKLRGLQHQISCDPVW